MNILHKQTEQKHVEKWEKDQALALFTGVL